MKRIVRILALLCLASALLCTAASADTGPKPAITVKLVNAPDEPYYLDLLSQGAEGNGMDASELAELDGDMLALLLASVPEGWHTCAVEGTGIPIFGELTSNDGVHRFSYHGTPDRYRILIVTASGRVWCSETLERRVLQSSVTVDWETGAVTAPAVWLAYVLQFLSCLVPTLLIEGLIALLFGYSLRRNWKALLWVNLLTQGLLALLVSAQALGNGVSMWFIFWFVPAELVIALAEAALYRKLLAGHSPRRGFAYGLTANLASAAAGWFILEPVWRWIVTLC